MRMEVEIKEPTTANVGLQGKWWWRRYERQRLMDFEKQK